MELELLHQQQLIVQDDLGGSLLVALDVGHKLTNKKTVLGHVISIDQ